MDGFDYLMQASDLMLSQKYLSMEGSGSTSTSNRHSTSSTTSTTFPTPPIDHPSVLLGDDQDFLSNAFDTISSYYDSETLQSPEKTQMLLVQPTTKRTLAKRKSKASGKSKAEPTKKTRKAPYAIATRDIDRPDISYAGMIVQAIVTSPGARMTLRGIYDWIQATYPFYKNAAAKNWQNSVRHNLSIHTHFVRLPSEVEKHQAFWTVEPRYLQKFELQGIVPEGTFNILHAYISTLIKSGIYSGWFWFNVSGHDTIPIPSADLWPVSLHHVPNVTYSKKKKTQPVLNLDIATIPEPSPVNKAQVVTTIDDTLPNLNNKQLEALLSGNYVSLECENYPPTSAPPDCDISRLAEISPCNFHQGMELLSSKSYDYAADIPLPLSPQIYENRSLLLIMDE